MTTEQYLKIIAGYDELLKRKVGEGKIELHQYKRHSRKLDEWFAESLSKGLNA